MTQTLDKARLVEQLYRKAEKCRMAYGFDKNTVPIQVIGKGELINRGYAEWKTLEEIAEELESGMLGR